MVITGAEKAAKLRDTHAAIAEHCCAIEGLFKPGAKVSVVVRNPGYGDADVFISNDDPEDVVIAIRGLQYREERKL